MGKASRRKRERSQGMLPRDETAQESSGAIGSVCVLNVGEGDLKLSFDKAHPAERARAATVVQDMLRRGYAILVQVGEQDGEPVYLRAKAFDPERCEYLVIGAPDASASALDDGPSLSPVEPAASPKKRHGSQTTRVPAERTRTVAVARSAGG